MESERARASLPWGDLRSLSVGLDPGFDEALERGNDTDK